MSATSSPAGPRGPLRLAAVVLLVGVLAVWLVKPIGNPCPDLARLPQGATAKSSPSFSPPLTRTCTYTAAAGVQVRTRYVPWLDWIVIVLLAAVAGGVARTLRPVGRPTASPRTPRERLPTEPRAARERLPKEPRTPRERLPQEPRAARERPVAGRDGVERDATDRERARRERAERARRST